MLDITIYRPPKQCPNFLDDFTELLSIVRTDYDNIMVIGDFKLHVDNAFLNMLSSMDFTQHVNGAIHNRGPTSSYYSWSKD